MYSYFFLATIETGMTYVQVFFYCILGGDQRRFSDMFRFVVCHLYDNFRHKIVGNSFSLWLPHNVEVLIQAVNRRLERTAVEVFSTDAAGNFNRRLVQDLFDMMNARVMGLIKCLGQGTARLRDQRQRHFYRYVLLFSLFILSIITNRISVNISLHMT